MEGRQNTFTAKYGDITLLLSIEVDEQLLKAIILFWIHLTGVSLSIRRT